MYQTTLILLFWGSYCLCLLSWSMVAFYVLGVQGFGRLQILPPLALTGLAYQVGGLTLLLDIVYIPMRVVVNLLGLRV